MRRAATAADPRPLRSCVACRARRTQDELVRVTVVDGRYLPDGPPGARRRSGRGAYLCPDVTCVERALARDAGLLRRALRSDGPCTASEELGRVGQPTQDEVPEASDGAPAS